MRQIASIPESIEMELEKLADKVIQARIKRFKFGERQKRATEYLESSHVYQYVVGSAAIGKPVTMTGREAYMRNKRLENLFWAELDKDKGARLARWRLVKANTEGKP